MLYAVKNNRLALEGRVDNLSKADEATLHKLAKKWQIGTQVMVKTTVQRQKDGRVIEQENMVYQNKPRVGLEEDIRRRLIITLDIPKELWTEKQAYAWSSNNLDDVKDVSAEKPVKVEAGILTDLKPFEEGLDQFNTSKLLATLTAEQWDFFKGIYNFHDKETAERDEGGRIIRERVFPQRLKVHEYIPENDEDIKTIEAMANSEAKKRSLEKYGKNKTK
jgi:hypothetical protein